MQASFIPTPSKAEAPARLQDDSTAMGERAIPARLAVGETAQDHSAAEDELDDAIRDLRTLAALAEDRGDIETAKEYTRRSLAASASRTPAHKDRLAREHLAMVERSLDEGCCYFAAEGDRARAQLERRIA